MLERVKIELFKVHFENDKGKISCSSSRFEFRGILCRYAITITSYKDGEKMCEDVTVG